MNLYRISLWHLGFIVFSGHFVASNADQKSQYRPIHVIVLERLNLMPEVAKVKWNKRLPIEDLKRERSLIRALLKDVPHQHQRRIKNAVEAQIRASKIIQEELFELWSSKGYDYFEKTRSLQHDLRPKITSLTNELIVVSLYHCKSNVSDIPELREFMIRPFQIAYEGINCFSEKK